MSVFPSGIVLSRSHLMHVFCNLSLPPRVRRWCTYTSTQLHEIGHNLNLEHSGEAPQDSLYADPVYDDVTGAVSRSFALSPPCPPVAYCCNSPTFLLLPLQSSRWAEGPMTMTSQSASTMRRIGSFSGSRAHTPRSAPIKCSKATLRAK